MRAALLRYEATVCRNPYIPHTPSVKQEIFLLHDDVREVMYGGAAGGGKTDALLMGALQYVATPGYAALVLMKTFADLALPSAGMSRLRDWLAGTGASPTDGGRTWRFPSGASITFGYLDNLGDEQRYRTAEFQYIAFDELTRFPERPYRFLFSRLRKPTTGPLSEVPLRMRSATNPGGFGHEWVKRRFIPDAYHRAKGEARFGRVWWNEGRLFVPARRQDNAHLDQDSYASMLSELVPLERAQLDEGDWQAHEGGHFKAEWFSGYGDMGDAWHVNVGGQVEVARKVTCQILSTVDPAGGVSEHADPTAMGVGALTPGGTLLILDVVRDRIAVEGIVPRLLELCLRWRPHFVGIEDGFLQSAYIRQARATHGIPTVTALDPEGRSKLVRATPAILRAEHGGIALPERAHWREGFLSELCSFTGDDKLDAHDDQVDMLSWMVIAIDRLHAGRHDDGPTIFRHGRR